MLVRHVARFGHQWRHLDRVAQHVDVARRPGLMCQEIHLAPALVGRRQTGLDGNLACAHRRHHVQHTGLHVVTELELERIRCSHNVHQRVLGAVLHDALVTIRPGLLEQWALGGHVVIGIKNQHLAAWLGLAEIVRDLTGALVRSGRAAIGCQRNAQRVYTTIGHGLELTAQCQGLGASFPGMQDGVLRTRPAHARQGFPHEVDAGGDDQAVIGQLAAASQADQPLFGIDRRHRVTHHPYAMAARQVVIRRGDIGHCLAAT